MSHAVDEFIVPNVASEAPDSWVTRPAPIVPRSLLLAHTFPPLKQRSLRTAFPSEQIVPNDAVRALPRRWVEGQTQGVHLMALSLFVCPLVRGTRKFRNAETQIQFVVLADAIEALSGVPVEVAARGTHIVAIVVDGVLLRGAFYGDHALSGVSEIVPFGATRAFSDGVVGLALGVKVVARQSEGAEDRAGIGSEVLFAHTFRVGGVSSHTHLTLSPLVILFTQGTHFLAVAVEIRSRAMWAFDLGAAFVGLQFVAEDARHALPIRLEGTAQSVDVLANPILDVLPRVATEVGDGDTLSLNHVLRHRFAGCAVPRFRLIFSALLVDGHTKVFVFVVVKAFFTLQWDSEALFFLEFEGVVALGAACEVGVVVAALWVVVALSVMFVLSDGAVVFVAVSVLDVVAGDALKALSDTVVQAGKVVGGGRLHTALVNA